MENSQLKFMKALSENSDDFFLDFVEQMPGGFFAYRADESEEILHLNKAALKIFGCDTLQEFVELTGNTFRGMVHPDDIDNVEKSIIEQITNNAEKTDYVEYRIKQKDGSTRWIADYGRFTNTKSFGDVFYVFIADSTERMVKRMERLENANKALLQISVRESQYRKAILHDALFFYEVNLSENRFITAVTQNGENNIFLISDIIRLKGNFEETSYTDFIAASKELVPLDDRHDYLEFFDLERLMKCCEKGELEQVYERRVDDKFEKSHLLHYVVLLGKSAAEDTVGALIIVKDITEQADRRKFLSDTLRQAQTAAIAKNTFLANMSHDIKTPLNAILGFADLIKDHVDDREKTKEYIEKIRISGDQLLTIVSEALEVTRMESGKAALAEIEGSLDKMIDEIEKSIMPQITAKNLHFEIDRAGIAHPNVLADFTRLTEVFVQLLDNAAKYTENGGHVSFKAEEQLHGTGYGKYVFTVEDTGSGISEEFMEHLFEPFARENNTTKSGILGSGLGMTVVKNILDLMGGKISVKSRLNEGSRFTVTVTLKQLENSENRSAAKPKKPVTLEGLRILLVEDNEINCEIAKELLCAEGFVVETASDGDIAVEMVRAADERYYDVILMDIQMPRMNGYDATRAIRALGGANADIPIIALSANTYAEDKKKSIESGMDAHAPKPLNMDNLLSLIADVLDSRS